VCSPPLCLRKRSIFSLGSAPTPHHPTPPPPPPPPPANFFFFAQAQTPPFPLGPRFCFSFTESPSSFGRSCVDYFGCSLPSETRFSAFGTCKLRFLDSFLLLHIRCQYESSKTIDLLAAPSCVPGWCDQGFPVSFTSSGFPCHQFVSLLSSLSLTKPQSGFLATPGYCALCPYPIQSHHTLL